MDLTFLSEFIVIITLAFCLGVGYVIKTSLDFIPNKYIPLIIGIIGVVFNAFVSGAIRILGVYSQERIQWKITINKKSFIYHE